MINYDKFLSSAGARMQESAIRKMGQVVSQATDLISFAPGYPAPETFAWADFRTITTELLSGADGTVLQYGPTRGHRPLLNTIVDLVAARHIACGPEHLLVTTGSQQGLDLVARVLLDPGDVALVELPSYTGAITAFRNVQAELVGVQQQRDGIDLDDLDVVMARMRSQRRRVRFLYVVPNFQNPTGLLMSLEKRRAVLDWAERNDILIVEDDPYRELYFEDSASEHDIRAIKADDRQGRVIYLSSFSKTLAPGYRVAWLVAPSPLAARLEVAKQAEDLCTGGLDQRVVQEACSRGVLARQAPLLRKVYQAKRDAMVTALKQNLGATASWPDPRGGFFLWLTLPNGADADRLLQRAVQHGVIFVAGGAFYVDGTGHNTMRLSFSQPSIPRIMEGVSRLAAAIREELAEHREATAGRVAP
jgi:2-aminoadipate transaminase